MLNIQDAITRHAQDAGPIGLSAGDISGHTANAVSAVCCRMTREGLLFRGKASHKSVRYFARQDWAMAHEDANRVTTTHRNFRSRASWAPSPKGCITEVDGITARTVFTRAPSPMDPLHTNTHADVAL